MSAILASLDALVTLARNAAALADVAIFDGQPVETESDLLAIGHDPDGDAVTTQVAADGLGSEVEVLDVSCWARAVSYNGIDDIPNVRARAVAVYEAFRASVKADPTLGGAVLEARPVDASFDQIANTDGAQASVSFTVRVSTFAA